jgi:hypothetical protein
VRMPCPEAARGTAAFGCVPMVSHERLLVAVLQETRTLASDPRGTYERARALAKDVWLAECRAAR